MLSVHSHVRGLVGLPDKPPNAEGSKVELKCNYCVNQCSLSYNDVSYCGLRNIVKNEDGTLPFPTCSKGYIHGYIDSNPTNCCNAWFCPAGTPNGYPKYSDYNEPEFGTYSYAAFIYGCSASCLYCQNWSHKIFSKRNLFNAETLANDIIKNKKITCLCYFGGTPEVQLPFTIKLAKLILKKIEKEDPKRKFRICWEMNGTGRRDLVEKCMKIAIKTGGNIKFDLKAFHEKLHMALCGISNKRTLENFKFLINNYFGTRKEEMPEISGCTLLVPGYINHEEVELIAHFISEINPKVPYNLLVFHGDYQMKDLTVTPRKQAERCVAVAKKYLEHVRLGNKFLLEFL